VIQDPIAARKKIGYLTELNALYYDMFVREYLLFMASLQQVPQAEKAVDNIIQRTGLLPEAHKQIAALSKGYKQRVGLAAALVHDPEVLILDEPTSGLDPNQLVEIRELIKTIGANKTVLFSTHILQEAEAICDRVILIHRGKIVADSLLSELHKKVSLPRKDMSLEEIFRHLTSS
jgi:ABC-2 type transport system ATP-binding protein